MTGPERFPGQAFAQQPRISALRERKIMPEIDRTPVGRRGFVVVTLLLIGTAMSGCAVQPAVKPPKILFVCQAGTAKSAIAREIFKQRAKERGIRVDVFSRGLVVADHVSPELKRNLQADGIHTSAEPALPLQRSDWASADILVNFNPLPASVKHKDVRDWSDVPSVNDDYENARAVMNKRIDALLNEIAGKRK
jgi:protein-tyrosine-phosphatase